MDWFVRRHRVLLAGIVTLALIVAACGSDDEETATSQPAAQPAAQTAAATPQPAPAQTTPTSGAMDGPKSGGVIKAVNEAGVGSLDNMFTSAFATRNVAIHMFENVTTLDANYAVRPMVADWAITGDGSVYTFTIRDGLTFHDGSQVTSADVLASIDRYNRASSAKAFFGIIMAQVEQIEEVDDSVFRITFKRPVPTLLNGLAASSGRVPHVMPKRLAETDHKDSVTEYIGTGPYMLKQWVQGDRVELERYDGYVAREEPNPASLRANAMPTRTRSTSLRCRTRPLVWQAWSRGSSTTCLTSPPTSSTPLRAIARLTPTSSIRESDPSRGSTTRTRLRTATPYGVRWSLHGTMIKHCWRPEVDPSSTSYALSYPGASMASRAIGQSTRVTITGGNDLYNINDKEMARKPRRGRWIRGRAHCRPRFPGRAGNVQHGIGSRGEHARRWLQRGLPSHGRCLRQTATRCAVRMEHARHHWRLGERCQYPVSDRAGKRVRVQVHA